MYGNKKVYTKRNSSSTRKYGKKKAPSARRNTDRCRVVSVPKQRTLWKNPIPQSGTFKFRYQDSGFDMSVGLPTYTNAYIFRGNSLYDPDATGVGVQPYGYDLYCGAAPTAIFQKYCVLASKIKIYPRCTTVQESGVVGARWIVCPIRTAPPTVTEFEDLNQIPKSRALVINSLDDQKGHLTAYCSTKSIFSEVPSLANDFSAVYSASPNSPWYWYVHVDCLSTDIEQLMNMDVQITYYCKLSKTDDVNES